MTGKASNSSTKLSDTQLTILSAASQRADRALVLPERPGDFRTNTTVRIYRPRGVSITPSTTP